MLSPLTANTKDEDGQNSSTGRGGILFRLVRKAPFLSLFALLLLSNAAGSIFSFFYNVQLIIGRLLDEHQQAAFWDVAVPAYNLSAYGAAVCWVVILVWPLVSCSRKLRSQLPVPPAELERCRRRLVNLPFWQVCVNLVGWLPGAVIFPWVVCGRGGSANEAAIWQQFGISFLISSVFTTVQTFLILEWYLIAVLYPDFFQDARPADTQGTLRIPFWLRLVLLWCAVAVMPLLALLAIALNLDSQRPDFGDLRRVAVLVAVAGILSGGFISWIVGRDLFLWLRTHDSATKQIEGENFDVRIPDKRPDDWGRLTDRFNDMAVALGRARQYYEAFGHTVGPETRDEIVDRYPGDALGGETQEVTVLFADIRGFTRRSSGEDPDRVMELLNRFLSLAVRAVEENRGMVNKFLGDGIMALFGAPRPRPDHADRAVDAARALVARLQDLNRELIGQELAPLTIGIGIHTGPALVGCVGAKVERPDGRVHVRKEYTAIGETVNMCQRVEQLTKKCGGPILISEQTRARLRRDFPLTCLGHHEVPGCPECVHVFQVATQC
jgi:adenylate cyclase